MERREFSPRERALFWGLYAGNVVGWALLFRRYGYFERSILQAVVMTVVAAGLLGALLGAIAGAWALVVAGMAKFIRPSESAMRVFFPAFLGIYVGLTAMFYMIVLLGAGPSEYVKTNRSVPESAAKGQVTTATSTQSR
ncbi:MAG: hypothetical protein HY078_16845 [Elusimicrobia bacterium]|nr:hypothetical protein [Elusimicrobiota bacterium]